ncbi:hypothetical protein VKT23_017247 [Stygiomarasmius scandens]|uniref:Heterokaryon incompatibility domain-containing protein n=1 Tax=Marasmiellus scandens TaxID=2682957 RepID=A0ABR1ISK9_9AGAR
MHLQSQVYSRWRRIPYEPKTRPYPSHRMVFQEDGGLQAIKNLTSPALMVPDVNICPRRLIDARSLELVEFNDRDTIPPYAILSHTWSKKGENIAFGGGEVVYAEFIQPTKETSLKRGYRKIKAACRQACRDGINYVWVDTCCIKQGNHEDVATNITSMYAYYQNAEVCYTYLVDVRKSATFQRSEEYDFEPVSNWFQRGWTLQELLAPRTVVFFDHDWRYIGDKYLLREYINQQTIIPIPVLTSEWSIQDVDILTRMSWSIDRRTTKPQDDAYCLQGLLGVLIEPDYDESWVTSFNRLGKAILDAQPELREGLGIDVKSFSNPNSKTLWFSLSRRFREARDELVGPPLRILDIRL